MRPSTPRRHDAIYFEWAVPADDKSVTHQIQMQPKIAASEDEKNPKMSKRA